MAFDAPPALVVCSLVLAPLATAQQPTLQRLHRAIPVEGYVLGAIAGGDVDGDGAPDLVVARAEFWSPTASVLRNDGIGVYAPIPGAWTSGHVASAIALDDLDGDGDLDLVELAEDHVGMYFNDGTGRFYDVSYQLPVLDGFHTGVAFLDAEGDGDQDLVLTRYDGKSRLLLNDGAAAFVEAPAGILDDPFGTASPEVGDVDGDGDLDILFGAYNDGVSVAPRLAINQGGTFVEAPLPAPLFDVEGPAVLVDVDQDQDLDVVLTTQRGPELWKNDGLGGFTSTGLLPLPGSFVTLVAGIEAGDFDGDGDADLVASFEIGTVLYANDGAGGFTISSGLPADGLPVVGWLVVADVDGDQDLDVILNRELVLNDGQGTFTTADSLSGDHFALSSANRIKLADMDGDGDRDLLTAPGGLFLNDRGTFVPTPSNPSILGFLLDSADLDGDGDLDAIAGSYGAGPFELYLGDGAGGLTDATATLAGVGSHKLSDLDVGDLDGDGDVDVLAATQQGGALLRNTGSGAFVDDSGALPFLGPELHEILVDVDLDGDLDLARGTLHTLYRNDGTGGFVLDPNALPEAGDVPVTVAAGDVDGDGDPDLLWGYGGLHNDRLYANDGAGAFTDATPIGLLFSQEPTSALMLADLDGDGDLDLVQSVAPSCVPFLHPIFGQVCITIAGSRNRAYLNDGAGQLLPAPDLFGAEPGAASDLAVDDVDGDGDVDVLTATQLSYAPISGVFRNTTRQVAWRGAPRIGKPLAMDVYGSPFAPWFLGASANTASIPLPGFGVLGIDPSTPILAVAGTLGLDGRATAGFAVPSIPALVGASAWWQALVGSPELRFTNVERTAFTDL